MARAAFVLDIKPDKVEEYVTAHRDVWPEMQAALTRVGIGNYSIHLWKTHAFGYFEADDPPAALVALADDPVNLRWQEAMAGMLEQLVSQAGPGLLPEIFRLDGVQQ